jgi:hypothetical protein
MCRRPLKLTTQLFFAPSYLFQYSSHLNSVSLSILSILNFESGQNIARLQKPDQATIAPTPINWRKEHRTQVETFDWATNDTKQVCDVLCCQLIHFVIHLVIDRKRFRPRIRLKIIGRIFSRNVYSASAAENEITICSIKRKENFFSPFLAREQKKQWKKFFLFIGHKVLFFETPVLHRARRDYVCGATTFGETGKSADWLAQIQPSSRWRNRSTNIRPM